MTVATRELRQHEPRVMMSMGYTDSYQSKGELLVHDIERMVHFLGEEGLGMRLRFMAPDVAQLETPEVLLSLVKQDPAQGPIG